MKESRYYLRIGNNWERDERTRGCRNSQNGFRRRRNVEGNLARHPYAPADAGLYREGDANRRPTGGSPTGFEPVFWP